MLYRVLKRDTFVVNREETINDCIRPSALYTIVSSHSVNNTKLELLKWRSTHVSSRSSVITVRTASDLDFLTKSRLSLSTCDKLVILSPYPSVPGLRSIVNEWRKETDQPIYLVSVSEEGNLEQLPDINLAFSVLCNVSIYTYFTCIVTNTFVLFHVKSVILLIRMFGVVSITCRALK